MKAEQQRRLRRSLTWLGVVVAWIALALILTFGTSRTPSRLDVAIQAGTNSSPESQRDRVNPALLRFLEQPASRFSPSEEDAERGNSEAIRDYQLQWEAHKSGVPCLPPPSL